ncbi:MAG: hypothetical protein ACREOO_16465 [bacterium]
MKKFLLLLFVLATTAVHAQDNVASFIELLRSEVSTNKKAIVTAAMDFTDAQASVFWPIYRNYEFDLNKLGDARVAMIKDYAENYEKMTDPKAKELAEKAFKFQEDRLKLRKKYFNELSKALSPTMAAKFAQVDNQIQLLIDMQIASELPLVEKPESAMK